MTRSYGQPKTGNYDNENPGLVEVRTCKSCLDYRYSSHFFFQVQRLDKKKCSGGVDS